MFRQGAGRLCLDFVRTLRYRGTPREVEEIADAEALTAWVRQCAPVEVSGMATEDLLAEARKLREAIHRFIKEGPGPRVVRERLNRAAARPVPAPRLDSSGHVRWLADDPVSATLSLLARDALDLVASGDVERVRECADPDCGALFFDGSRPGKRRWCSMNVCGNKAKKSGLKSRIVVGDITITRPTTN